MNKESKITLECIELLAEYLEATDKKTWRTKPLRKIRDKVYTLFNPNKTGDCCGMDAKETRE